ncbi:MAG: cytidylate kinase [Verrucomicrobia bacterium TMED44]|nr:MAG: cytidylate kinase [Verrucomicrobia bacterium TMED44]
MTDFITIAIDGGAGTGKSTLSSLLSEKNNYLYVETGSHYRALTCILLKQGLAPENVTNFVNENPVVIESEIIKKRSYIVINQSNFISENLRSQNVNENVSYFAAIPALRKSLFNYQRSQINLARRENFSGVILEGRDIGTKILPDADLKVFLHADINTRIQRRNTDGESDTIIKRDQIDSNRKDAPLACAEGALSIDTGKYSAQEVYDIVMESVNSF